MAPVGNLTHRSIVCYAPTMITTNGVWQGDNPLDYALPLFTLQLTLIIATTRLLVFIMKPLRQPRVIPEILGGIILGPSIFGQIPKFADTLFPARSVMILETMANIGILYFLFLVGIEMDIGMIKNTGRRAVVIASAGMLLPFLIGISFAFTLHTSGQWVKLGTFILFLGVALSVTAFPVLARILAELKLLNTEIGRLAMAAALISDVFAWILLTVAIAIAEDESMSLSSTWVLFSSAAFALFCVCLVRPMILWVLRRTPEGEAINEFYISLILTLVMIFGFVTDAIGTHAVFGAFIFGLIIPNGPIGIALIENLEDFVSTLLLPIFFAISGLKTDLTKIHGAGTWSLLALVIVLATLGKVIGTLLASLYCNIPFYEGLTLGLLMNTKGLLEMIVLNVGRDQKVLDEKSFAILIIVAVVMTAIVQPAVTNIQKPGRKCVPYKRRTIQQTKPDGHELRLLVCVHTPRNVPTIIHLLEATRAAKKSQICAYVLHLLEVTGRQSAMLIVHNMAKLDNNQTDAQSYPIFNAFENFVQQEEFISINPLTVISPSATIHEDICSVAEDKRVALIIIPFHKQQMVDGSMEVTNPAFRTVNQNVLDNAPCSVAILVDRGFNGPVRSLSGNICHHIAVLFFGGPDDREALAYGWRLSEHPLNNLTVLHFVVRGKTQSDEAKRNRMDGVEEEEMDKEYLHEFRKATDNNSSVVYVEREVGHGEETVAIIRSIDKNHDLFIVGRGRGTVSPLTVGLSDWSECPELGTIGDLLASPDFPSAYSVLVVQQYQGAELIGDETTINMPESPNAQAHVEFPQPPTPETPPSPDERDALNHSPQGRPADGKH